MRSSDCRAERGSAPVYKADRGKATGDTEYKRRAAETEEQSRGCVPVRDLGPERGLHRERQGCVPVKLLDPREGRVARGKAVYQSNPETCWTRERGKAIGNAYQSIF